MWYLFSLPQPQNKDKKWDLILHQSIFTLDRVKRHVQILQKGSKADKYVLQNLAWSGLYLRSTLSNNILQKLLTLLSLTATGPEFFVSTMTTFISDYYYALEYIITHMKSLKLKNYPG